MAKNLVEILVRAKDEASRELGAANKSLGDTIQNMQKAGQVMAVAGAAIAGGLFAITQAAATTGDNMAKMADRFGLTSDVLSELDFAAQLAGSNFNTLSTGLKKLSKTANDAKDGMKEYQEAFDAVGVSVTDASGQLRPVEEMLFDIADAMMVMENQTEKVAVAQDLLGRGGAEMVVMLQQGGDAIREQMVEARALGASYDEVTTKKAEDFIDAQLRISKSLEGVRKVIGEELMPVMTDWQNKIALVIADIGKWIDANEKLVTSIGAISLALLGGAGLIFGAGLFSKILAIMATGLGVVTSGVGAAVIGIGLLAALIFKLTDGFGLLKGSLPSPEFGVLARLMDSLSMSSKNVNEQLSEFTTNLEWLKTAPLSLEFMSSEMARLVAVGETNGIIFETLAAKFHAASVNAGLFTGTLKEMMAIWSSQGDAPDVGVPGLSEDQLAQAEKLQASLAQMAFTTEQQRRGFVLEGINMELAQRTAAGEEEFAIIQGLAQRKLNLELEMKREELKQKQEMLTAAFEAELEKLPEESEERLALHQEFIDQVAALDEAALEEKMLTETQAQNDLDALRIQSEENYKKKQTETSKDMVANVKRISGIIQGQLVDGLIRVLRHTGNIRDMFSRIGDTILREVLSQIIKTIAKLIVMKTILKGLSFGILGGGGIVGSIEMPTLRAAGGMMVPAFAGSGGPRVGTDTVPILATPGEAVLPVWLVTSLRNLLTSGSTGSGGRFQSGGVISGGAGGASITIQGNVYANDERQVDELMERMSDAVQFRNVSLVASTAREIG